MSNNTKIYTIHTVNDGRWQIVLHLRENDDFRYKYEHRPDLRALVDEYYNSEPTDMARKMLESVLHCDAVQVNLMCGPSVYMERE